MPYKAVRIFIAICLTLAWARAGQAQYPGFSTKPFVVFQPSHKRSSGPGLKEAETCDAIVEYALKASNKYDGRKVWSYHIHGLHHADSGSNTVVAETAAVLDGRISGYAWEIKRSNSLLPRIFVSVHNSGGTGRHAVWGYVHDGDKYERGSRRLSDILLEAVSRATTLENRGTYLDSSARRDDYRCRATDKPAFYSLDENVNAAPYRVMLEIGDAGVDAEYLSDELNRLAIGEAIGRGLERFIEENKNGGTGN